MPRKRLEIEGIVQGVGFRPFVYQTARRIGVAGWVRNDSRGVTIEVEGEQAQLEQFLRQLREQLPPLASISRLQEQSLPLCGEQDFRIRPSAGDSLALAQVAPDGHVCADCLRELFDPTDRRYRYPFINCTNCGPRYTIVTAIPYDRPFTTMVDFPMCPACRFEYADPESRRFHAQPNACPECGPQLALHDAQGQPLAAADPLAATAALLSAGKIVAIKGLGGYHLAVDAANDGALAELRRRKGRDEKPFALMAFDLQRSARLADIDATEQRLLESPERPIVLLRRRCDAPLSPLVAPHNRYLGVMLPYTPLHYLLLQQFPALVMTSANLSDEPIAFEDADAGVRLAQIADAFLSHNRRIQTRTDDSIGRVMGGKALLLRRSRGFVPRALALPAEQPRVLALGAELKSTFCLTRGDRAFLSQHIGDLKNQQVYASFADGIAHLQGILQLQPQIVAHDLHPDYLSSRYAEELVDLPRVAVQHHHAHLVSCLAENGVSGPALGVIFDGLGYGSDGRLWGGEFLLGDARGFQRLGHLAYLPMPGGDAATREPWRMAVAALVHAYGDELPHLPWLSELPAADLRLLRQMIAKGLNAPLSSSCGRLFDAVAALAGVRQRVSYEGQAALELEMALEGGAEAGEYPFELQRQGQLLVLDPAAMIRALVADLQAGTAPGLLSARFHNGLARAIGRVCHTLRRQQGIGAVALSGGVFQNRYLTERTLDFLGQLDFTVYTHSLVPPNDGGLALGQAVIAGAAGVPA